jgi:hypothetical protein
MKKNSILPNFLIIGAAKSGTTLLYYLLTQHEDIFMPKLKEPHFLSLGTLKEKAAGKGKYSIGIYIDKIEDYLSLFKDGEKKLKRGEASISYLEFPDITIKNILKYLPEKENTKIIIMIRNPIERAFSHYMMKKRDGFENLSFWEAIQPDTIEKRLKEGYDFTWNYISLGFYSEKIKKYQNIFPDVKVLIYEKFIQNMSEQTKDVVKFLNLPVKDFNPSLNIKVNPSGIPKGNVAKIVHKLVFHQNILKTIFKQVTTYKTRMYLKSLIGDKILSKPEIDEKSRIYLKDIYSAEINKLENLLNLDLDKIWKI